MYKKKYLLNISFIFLLTLTACSKASFTNDQVLAMSKSNPSSDYRNAAFLQGNPTTIWYKLQQTSSVHLTQMLKERSEPNDRGWIELALINKRYSTNKAVHRLPDQLISWRSRYPGHPGNALMPNDENLHNLTQNHPPSQIAILLPQSGPYAASSRHIRAGILNAYYAKSGTTNKQNIKFYDTAHTSPTALYEKATSEGADFVIGPLTKNEVNQLKQTSNFTAPIIALNYADNSSANTNFYEFGLLPEDEATMAAERAYQQGLSQAIVIAPDNDWGKRVSQTLSNKWRELGGKVQDTWLYQARSNFNEDIAKLLKVDLKADKMITREANKKEILDDQRRNDFNVIFLFAQNRDARVIVPLLRYYYASNVPIYASSSVFAGKMLGNDSDLNGVIVCDIPWSKQPASSIQGHASNRLYAIGQDAYTLSQSLPTLSKLNNFPLYGKTGALAVTNTQQIHRRIPCRVIRHGVV